MTLSEKGLNFIKSFEGFSSTAYLCPAGYETIGYGHLIKKNEEFTSISDSEALELLRKDILHAENKVNRLTHVELTQNQFDAIVSFVFNVGAGAYQRSTLRAKINRREHQEASLEFMKWIRVNGVVSKGLVNRRFAEAELYSR